MLKSGCVRDLLGPCLGAPYVENQRIDSGEHAME